MLNHGMRQINLIKMPVEIPDVIEESVGELVEDVLLELIRLQPAGERARFIEEFLDVLESCYQTGDNGPLERLLNHGSTE